MTEKTKVELVRWFGELLQFLLPPCHQRCCQIAQSLKPLTPLARQPPIALKGQRLKSATTRFSSGATETAPRCLWCMGFLEAA